eukprot:CAMPEP_0119126282 /NCGR_PEP_ID=MMETSP1310-20130426/5270_1 /TAXON_ID=464262 /ORGANISM="Genus nov. species nov., Strain RCC2339" /LENGTH=217 /DNA_ID=CAMNT_0007116435 /DNA_START=86 /DNA_END=739 /DNA_ORIENTATION=+
MMLKSVVILAVLVLGASAMRMNARDQMKKIFENRHGLKENTRAENERGVFDTCEDCPVVGGTFTYTESEQDTFADPTLGQVTVTYQFNDVLVNGANGNGQNQFTVYYSEVYATNPQENFALNCAVSIEYDWSVDGCLYSLQFIPSTCTDNSAADPNCNICSEADSTTQLFTLDPNAACTQWNVCELNDPTDCVLYNASAASLVASFAAVLAALYVTL